LALTFELSKDEVVKSVDIQWPSGRNDHLTNLKVNQRLTLREGQK
jgi:hypothetical protein